MEDADPGNAGLQTGTAARRAAKPHSAASRSRLRFPAQMARRNPPDRPRTPPSPHQRRTFLERQTLGLEPSKFPSVNTSATRLTGLSRRRDTSSGTPSGRGERRAGVRHRPGGRKVSMTVRPLWFAFRGQRGGCVACWIRRLRKVSMTVRPLWFALRGQRGGCVACWIRRLAC